MEGATTHSRLYAGSNMFNFGDDPDHHPESGVRIPKSGFTGLFIMLAFGGGLRSLSTSIVYASRDDVFAGVVHKLQAIL